MTAAHALRGEGAPDRLAYDELLANQLALLLVRASTRRRRGRALPGTGALTGALVASLPWPLTGAQRRASEEIRGDLAQSAPMLRLLQGDVGAGKTLVALLAMLTAVESGAQAAFLAPTEILARQHAAKLAELLGDLPVRIALLTGRDKGRERLTILAGLADGTIDILIGTHAIFQEAVEYRDLGLVVVDEQHKFGVNQRLMLSAKGTIPPHLLVMTATPIPRTLALTAYGEMDVSKLDELPPGRQPIDTRVVSAARIEDVVAGLARHLDARRAGLLGLPAGRGVGGGRRGGGDDAGGDAARALRRHRRAGPRADEGPRKGRGDGGVRRRPAAGAGGDDGDRGRRRRAERDADDRRGGRALRPRPAPPAARAGRARARGRRSASCCAARQCRRRRGRGWR